MIIKGIINYNNNGVLTDKTVEIDTDKQYQDISEDVCDAVSFALYGKTIYRDIINTDTGVPTIILSVECGGKTVYIVRQPQYIRETNFGTRYLSKEVLSLKTDQEEYESLSEDKYYKLINKYINISYDELFKKR